MLGAPHPADIPAATTLADSAETHTVGIHQDERENTEVHLPPQDITRRIVAVQHLLLMHVGSEITQLLRQQLITGLHRADIIEGAHTLTLHTDEIAVAEHAAMTLLEICHRGRGVDITSLEDSRIGEGTQTLRLADAEGIDQAVEETRRVVALDIERGAVGGREDLDRVTGGIDRLTLRVETLREGAQVITQIVLR